MLLGIYLYRIILGVGARAIFHGRVIFSLDIYYRADIPSVL
jgi:hypothetical protein